MKVCRIVCTKHTHSRTDCYVYSGSPPPSHNEIITRCDDDVDADAFEWRSGSNDSSVIQSFCVRVVPLCRCGEDVTIICQQPASCLHGLLLSTNNNELTLTTADDDDDDVIKFQSFRTTMRSKVFIIISTLRDWRRFFWLIDDAYEGRSR